ncbi:hypothetical protein OG875_26235 [Streptomyces sp. NBC_01498]|uniref:hypothetical protein n=1 Tax=Streptomyces sp. NBC_01498 TaxID=2975870 RepID=UPI002E7BF296|nr:hypothetical protein [Streptomyces sp. NBC_01498]WTL27762.1 hypothetical protein OG875_26235 [Streptomyces sp. NBC_01498]
MPGETGLPWLAEQCGEPADPRPAELDLLVERGPVSAMVLIAERSVTDLATYPARTRGLAPAST